MFTLETLIAFYLKPQKKSIKKWMTDQLDEYRQRLAAKMPTIRVEFGVEKVRAADYLLYDFVRGNPNKITLSTVMEAYENSDYFTRVSQYCIIPLAERIQLLELNVSEIMVLLLSALTDESAEVRAYIPEHCLKRLRLMRSKVEFLDELQTQLIENQAIWVSEVRDKLAGTPLTGKKKTHFLGIIDILQPGKRIYNRLNRAKNIGQAAQILFEETEGVPSDELKAVLFNFCQHFLIEHPFIQDNQYYKANEVFLRNRQFLEVILSETQQPRAASSSRESYQRYTFFCLDLDPDRGAQTKKRCSLA